MKNCKDGNFWRFLENSGIFDRNAILISIFVQKIRKKLMMKSQENAQRPVFPAYSRHFCLESCLIKLGHF